MRGAGALTGLRNGAVACSGSSRARRALRRLSLPSAVALLACALLPSSAAGAFSLVHDWGGQGLGVGMFKGEIAGLATDAGGDVYVVDQGGNRIEEFGAMGTFEREWGSQGGGAGQMYEPVGIAVAGGGPEAGDVYVTDPRNYRVDEFTSVGKFIRTWGFGVKEDHKVEFQICTENCHAGWPDGSETGGFEEPIGVAVDPNSGDVYVSDYNLDGHSIYKYEPSGAFLSTVGLSEKLYPPGHAGTFSAPTALATDSAGDLYVVDAGNERVEELNKEGNFVRTWGRGVHKGESGLTEKFGVCASGEECQAGGVGEAAGDFNFISGSGEFNIAVDSSGNVWVPDSGDYRVQEFTSEGAFVMGFGWGVLDGTNAFETCTTTCGIGIKGGSPPQFERPVGVAAAPPSGCGVYVTDGGANDLVDNFGESSSVACGGVPPAAPTAVTTSATSVTQTTATLNAMVNPNGSEVNTCTFEYGLSTAYGSAMPCAFIPPGSGSSPVPVSAAIGGLSPGTIYHFRIVAGNGVGPAEGADETFTTPAPTEGGNPNGGGSGEGGSNENGVGPSSTETGQPPAGIASTARAIEELELGCGARRLALTDVFIRGGRVRISGSAAVSLAGSKVKILFKEGKSVASAKVGVGGQFSTSAPLPPSAIRESASTRYTAEIGSQRSLPVSLFSAGRARTAECLRIEGHPQRGRDAAADQAGRRGGHRTAAGMP